MVDADSDWLLPHYHIYKTIKADLQATPARPPISTFLNERVPSFWKPFYRTMAYLVEEGNKATYCPVNEGDPVVFWNGSEVETSTWDLREYHVGDFSKHAQAINALAKNQNCFVVDLGAGTCLQALALRAAGFNMPIYNLDLFPDALQIGAMAAAGLGLKDIQFGNVNISGALANAEARKQLTTTIKNAAAGLPIIVVSRYAMYPFYTPEEQSNVYSWILDDLGAAAGLHQEMCGHNTKTYRTICEQMGRELHISAKSKAGRGEPLGALARLPAIQVIERSEIWPHILGSRFPSYISWHRD